MSFSINHIKSDIHWRSVVRDEPKFRMWSSEVDLLRNRPRHPSDLSIWSDIENLREFSKTFSLFYSKHQIFFVRPSTLLHLLLFSKMTGLMFGATINELRLESRGHNRSHYHRHSYLFHFTTIRRTSIYSESHLTNTDLLSPPLSLVPSRIYLQI